MLVAISVALQQCESSHFTPADGTFGSTAFRSGGRAQSLGRKGAEPGHHVPHGLLLRHRDICNGCLKNRTSERRLLCSPLEQIQRQNTAISTSEQINTWSAQIPVLGADMDRARLDGSHNLDKLKHIQYSTPTSDTLMALLAENPEDTYSSTTFYTSGA